MEWYHTQESWGFGGKFPSVTYRSGSHLTPYWIEYPQVSKDVEQTLVLRRRCYDEGFYREKLNKEPGWYWGHNGRTTKFEWKKAYWFKFNWTMLDLALKEAWPHRVMILNPAGNGMTGLREIGGWAEKNLEPWRCIGINYECERYWSDQGTNVKIAFSDLADAMMFQLTFNGHVMS